MKEDKLRNKYLYKIEILILKVLPMIMAGLHLLNMILSYFNIDMPIISYIGGVGIIPLLFIYVSSYVFKFCSYHRMFLHYIVVSNIVAYIDYEYVLPISDLMYLMLHLIIAGIFLFIILYLKINVCQKQ